MTHYGIYHQDDSVDMVMGGVIDRYVIRMLGFTELTSIPNNDISSQLTCN